MLTLALETSTSVGGVAISKDGKVLSRQVWSRDGSHGEALTPAIETALSEANVRVSELDAIAVGRGPGSFTGVRIAVNAARSLAYALKKPVHAFTTHEILAAGVPPGEVPLLTLVNAHKNMIFTARFTHANESATWQQDLEIRALTIDELDELVQEPHLCIGDGYEEYESFFPTALRSRLIRNPGLSDHPLPEFLAQLASKRPANTEALDWKDVQALYIRASGAEEKLRESREK